MDDVTENAPAKESKTERRHRKEAERLADTRPLESWERYRALSDLVDHMLDVVELADRRTRFALLILGALNAVNLLIVVRLDALGVQGLNLTFVRTYFTCYVLLSLYFFSYAIVALRPRLRQGRRNRQPGNPDLGKLRLIDDILDQDVDAYYERWQHTQVGQLNREMAFHAHIFARTNAEKYHALGRLYLGLVILVVLTAILVAVVGIHALPGSPV